MHILRALLIVLSCLFALGPVRSAQAHETRPAVADVTIGGQTVTMRITMPLEPVLVGMNLAALENTNDSPLSLRHDALRALPGDDLETQMRDAWPRLSTNFRLTSDGAVLPFSLQSVSVPDSVPTDLARDGTLTLVADLPSDAAPVSFSWSTMMGPIILRQTGENGYTGYLTGGISSPPLQAQGTSLAGGLVSYLVAGFRHIIPLGADHIAFVLGLFFYSTRMRPLLLQVTAFTLAHSVTLGLATFGLVNLPRGLVEPIIAASIIWIAVENIWKGGAVPTPAQARNRLAIVAGFGLLHGMGFAAMLAQIGLPDGARLASLAAFNVGVEIGQLAVIAIAFVTVGYWFRDKPWYTAAIARPASVLIGFGGVYWLVAALA